MSSAPSSGVTGFSPAPHVQAATRSSTHFRHQVATRGTASLPPQSQSTTRVTIQTRKPILTSPLPPSLAIIQRALNSSGSEEDDDKDATYEFDEEQERQDLEEEEVDGKRFSKENRPPKPKGTLEQLLGKAKFHKTPTRITHQEAYEIRKKQFGGKLQSPPPKLKGEKSVYSMECHDCDEKIFMDKNKKEMGVFRGHKKTPLVPPDAHKLDYNIYKGPLEEEAKNIKSPNTKAAFLKHGAWDLDNTNLTHYDCNARQKKITNASMTKSQEEKGRAFVKQNKDKWLRLAKKSRSRFKTI